MEASGGESNPITWDTRYLSKDTPWDKGEPAPPLEEFLEKNTISGRVFVPGCGTGQDVRALSRKGADVTGLDFAPQAVAAASRFPRVGNEIYEVGDLFALPSQHLGAYDWVYEHTCFCAIDPARRNDYVKAVASVLKTDGRLLAVFYLNPNIEGDGPPFGVTLTELDEFFGPFFSLEQEWQPTRSFPGRENREIVRILKKR